MGFSVLNKEEAVLAKVSVPSDFGVLVCFGCSVDTTVAFSVEKEEEADVVDIVTTADSFPGSSVLNMEDDVTVTVSCVDTSNVWSPELSSRVGSKTEMSSGLTENVSDWLVVELC